MPPQHSFCYNTQSNVTATVADILGPWCSRIQFYHDLFGSIYVEVILIKT